MDCCTRGALGKDCNLPRCVPIDKIQLLLAGVLWEDGFRTMNVSQKKLDTGLCMNQGVISQSWLVGDSLYILE